MAKEESAEEIARPQTPPNEDFAANGNSDAEAVPMMAEKPKPKVRNTRAVNSNAARAALAPKSRPFVRRRGVVPILKTYAKMAYSTAEERPLLAGVVSASAIILAIAPIIYHLS